MATRFVVEPAAVRCQSDMIGLQLDMIGLNPKFIDDVE